MDDVPQPHLAPTLSVLTRVNRRIEATIQLSYLARGFDWAAELPDTANPAGMELVKLHQ